MLRTWRTFVLMLLAGATLAFAAPASGATIDVNSTLDPGDGTCDVTECTLREAITQANTTVTADTITFTGLTSGDQTVTLASALPAVTQPLTIDGTTHPDYSTGVAPLAIDGAATASGDGLHLTAGNTTIKALRISGFQGNGITIDTAGGDTLLGNEVGVTPSGANHGIGIAVSTNNNVIGATTAGDGNHVSGAATTPGIAIVSGTGNAIRGNTFESGGHLPVDLGTDGQTINDALDADNGPNGLQNHPVLTSFTNDTLSSTATFVGSLNAKANTAYTLDFFIGNGCGDSGMQYVGSLGGVTTNGSGVATFNQPVSTFVTAQYGTVTATDPAGNTSEVASPADNGATAVAGLKTTCDPGDIAQAIAATGGTVTGAAYLALPGLGHPSGVGTTSLAGFPTDGGSYGILSSGTATHLAPLNDAADVIGGDHQRGDTDYDVSVLRVDLNVPGGANCLTLDFRFLSDEFPQYLNTAFNDAFIAELDTTSWTTAGSVINAPDNFAFDPSHDVISINSSGNTSMSHAETAGTGYDGGNGTTGGATPLLHASKVVTSGVHHLYLSLFDQGDQFLDSAVQLDNLRFSTRDAAACASGATSDTTAPVVTLVTPANGSSGTDTTPTYSGAAGNLGGDLPTITTKIYAGTGTGGAVVQTVTATQSGGAWTVDGSTPLAPGTYTAQAQQSDSAGNTGFSTANTFTITSTTGLSVDDVTTTEGNAGTTNATFTVTLNPAAAGTVTVHYATTNGTATQPGDYTSASGDLTFTAGQTTKTVNVPIVGDTTDEPDETYSLVLSSPVGAGIVDGTGAGTITDDDGPPTVAIDDQTVAEGSAGTTNATFTVSLSAASGKTITVHYSSLDGTAAAPGDYTAVGGDLTFTPGQTSKTVSVPIVGDTTDEPDETFTVALTVLVNVGAGDVSGLGTITDDDAAPALSVSNQSVTEGNSGTTTMTFTVTLAAASGKTVGVHYATSDGSATQPSDYASAAGDLSFTPGQTSKTFTVGVVGDTTIEPDETFGVTLSAASNASLGGPTATGTIINDDVAGTGGGSTPPVVPVVSVGSAGVNPEGDTGSKPATFTVTLSAATTVPVTVKYATADVTATAPADYAATAGILTFSPGQTSKTVAVLVAGDTLVEADETFRLQLSDPGAATLGTAQGTGTIVDDDKPPVVKPPGSVPGAGVFCGTQHRGRCNGLQFTAQFQNAPGNASWTFDAYNPTPGKGRTRAAARAAAVVLFRVGTLKKQITSKAPVKVTFKVTGKKADLLLRTIRKRGLTRLRITTTFVGAGGKKTKTVSVVKLR